MKILYMGRKPVAARCLSLLMEKPEVEIVGVLTDSHLQVSPTAELAKRNGLPLYGLEEALAAVENGLLKFDLGLSMLYWRRLRGHLLTVPSLGVVNFHPAPLPNYKGVGGYNLAILEGLNEWAVSAHYVDQNIDTGEIIKVQRFAIDPEGETAQSLEKKSQLQLEDLFKHVVGEIIGTGSKLKTFDNEGGGHLSRKELEEMKKVDCDVDDIPRKIRAFWFPPYDGAFVEIKGEKYTLVSRQILEDLGDPAASSLFTPKKSD